MRPQSYSLDDVMDWLRERAPHQDRFHQAAKGVLHDILPLIEENTDYQEAAILERLVEPERVIVFRVPWESDDGEIRVNRGYRVQFNSAIGPYKGGLRFHPSVDLSTLKFLGFEQIFKNALTGLPMGAGKGGADFNPAERSLAETRRFCQAFMRELYRHIGPDTDVPAGDMNVGGREIGWLYGAYRKITNRYDAALTGKGLCYGGSELRVEATGYGLVHFVENMLSAHDDGLDGKTVAISGAGNVATHAAEKALAQGAKVISLSDSGGAIFDEEGLTEEKIAWTRDHKQKPGASLEGYADEFGAEWREGQTPWRFSCDVALPCATENELDEDDARRLIENGVIAVAEGANMPATDAAKRAFRDAEVLFGPGKAANAGGVAVSGLEIAQNRERRGRARADIAEALEEIMSDIHDACAQEAREANGEGERVDYVLGANRRGFRKVAGAMIAQGLY